ncbi:MAG: hypothetical protein Q9160_007359 [Pyrenula sp. 1 TL-2023]
MHFPSPLPLLALPFLHLLPSTLASQFETLRAVDLLGSHFGVPGFNTTYDYVIVGGGTAGLTMATRLAENGKYTVAVIEAGSFYEFDNGNHSSIPADVAYNLGSMPRINNPLIDWQQFTEPQGGLNDRRIFYTRGKVLGGSSARNFMAYQRSTKGSYDLWAEEVGDRSYRWENLLPFFKKSVTFQPPNSDFRPANSTPDFDLDAFSSSGGPLTVTFPNWANAWTSWVERAFQEMGFARRAGFLSGKLLGYSYVTSTIDRESQERASSEYAFLRKALLYLTNLTVYKSTLAKKILFDNNKRATGVLVETVNIQYTLFANKEVILTSGALRSPQLLMVSGIGPRSTLAKLSIPVLSHLAGVGQNMWDHLLFSISYEVDLLTHSQLANPSFLLSQQEAYNTNRTGMLTNQGDDMLAWEKLPARNRRRLSPHTRRSLAQLPSDWPEVEFLLDDAYFGFGRDLIFDAPQDGKNYASVAVALVAPFSKGNVTIVSADTNVNPAVDPNYLLDPRDREVAIQAFRRARDVFASQALKPVLLGEEAFPGRNVSTDAEILDFIRESALEVYHVSATCKMGRKGDRMAVIDSKARVFGVRGLRVVDASSFPFLPPGHPQATVYALAEKIADEILTENARKEPSFDEGEAVYQDQQPLAFNDAEEKDFVDDL